MLWVEANCPSLHICRFKEQAGCLQKICQFIHHGKVLWGQFIQQAQYGQTVLRGGCGVALCPIRKTCGLARLKIDRFKSGLAPIKPDTWLGWITGLL
jgi:hypothetical protein